MSTAAVSCGRRRATMRAHLLAQKMPPAGSGGGFEEDPVALAFQGANGVAGGTLGVAAIEVVDARLAIVHTAVEQVIGGDEHRVGDGDDGLLVAAVPGDAAVPSAEGGGAAAAGEAGGLDEGHAEPAVAGASTAGFAFAGA